ncbi:MAG: NUDIX domain-containing protein, partial [Bacilli bacterium]|nr:NUDIX domain-containing protein [Bacilli bacterium]
NNEILLQKRSMTKRFNPGKWGLCAGHVDSGESLEDAAIREVKEEIGIDITKDDLHTFTEKEINIRNKNSHIAYFYYVKADIDVNKCTIQEEELSEVKWFNVDYLIELVEKEDTSTVFTKERLSLLNDIKKVMNQ